MTVQALFGTGDSTATTTQSSANITGAKPSNAAVGDTIFGWVYSQVSGTFSAHPTGWSQVGNALSTRTGALWAYSVTDATALSNLQASPVWTSSGGAARNGAILWRARGVNATILDVSGSEISLQTSTITYTSITTTVPGSLLLCLSYSNHGTTAVTFSPPGSMTDGQQVEIVPASGNHSAIDVAYEQLPYAPAATGTRAVGISPASTAAGGLMIAIAAAPAMPFTSPTLRASRGLVMRGRRKI